MRSKYFKSTSYLLILVLSLTIFALPVGAIGIAPNLGTASAYGILGATTTVTGQTYVTGSLGSGGATGTAVVTGSNDIANTAYTTAFTNLGAAITHAGSQQADFTGVASDLGGQTLSPGVHNFTGAVTIGSNTTLSGNGVFIFQIDGAFSTAASTVTQLTYGAQSCNIFWVVNVATIGANSTLEGTLMSKSAITIGAGSVTNGRVLAQTAVTANAASTSINVPGACAALVIPPVIVPPTVTSPSTTSPSTTSPSTTSPSTTSPSTTSPSTTSPSTTSPSTTSPSTTSPSTTSPSTTSPSTTELPTTSLPITELPTTALPTTEPPATEPPTTEPPTTEPPATEPPVPSVPRVPTVPFTEVCTSPSVSVLLNSKGDITIHAILPNDAKGTGTWIFNLGGKIYKVHGSEDVTYTAENAPVGAYKIGAQFIPDDNGEIVDLALCTVSVPTTPGGELPNTATPWFNLLLVGAVLSIIGLTIRVRRKTHE
ncbi:ice-binding family protein [Paenibacillus agricola]|uniref:ice-binding family protein n=1 Tax=Paenibacillus agricola TaxID=2716264 RepID=UPI001A9EE9DA